MSKINDYSIEKLKGSENFHTWKFAIKNYLEMSDLENCVEEASTDGTAAEGDVKKQKKAKNVLSLSVDCSIFVHIQSATTALEIWKTLHRLYDDKGLSRKIGLLRSLISIRLEDSSSMQDYVDQVMSNANKLVGVGFDISDEWIGAILLAGLTEEYRPLIMGIESSEKTLTGDAIVSKLLDNRFEGKSKEGAFLSKKKKENKCRNCGKDWNRKHKCANKDEKSTEKKSNSKTFGFLVQEKDEVAMLSANNTHEWFIDSGASSHMTPFAGMLNKKQLPSCNEIVTANNSKLQVKAVGNARIKFHENEIEIADILHVPNLAVNLLSVHKMVSKGNIVTFDKNGCTIYDNEKRQIAKCSAQNGVYKLKTNVENCMLSNEKCNTAVMWHRRLGHINYQNLCKMRDGAVRGIEFDGDESQVKYCDVCAMGKQSRLPFKKSKSESKQLLELIHSDIVGPMETLSIGKARYLLTFIDDHSRKVFCYFLKHKSETYDCFTEFKNKVENHTERKIKYFRTDNGTEYTSTKFETLFKNAGIQHQLTTPYTPQQNGIAERYNRTIIERAKCLLFDAKLAKTFWAEAVNMAVYLVNRTVNANSGKATPEEIWTGSKIDLSHVKLFGTPIMVHIPKEKRVKWDPKSTKMVFVGYDPNTKGYRCANTSTRKIIVSRDVIFHEDMSKQYIQISASDELSEGEESDKDEKYESFQTEINNDDVVVSSTPTKPAVDETSDDSITTDDKDDEDYVPEENIRPNESYVAPRTRTAQLLASRFFSMANFACEHDTEIALKCDEELFEQDPVNVSDIAKRNDQHEWKKAMEAEIGSLLDNNTWTLTELPKGKKTVKAKWIFKTKRDGDGNVVRHKARLVAKGYTQRYGIDYEETYAPVVRYTTIRLLMAIAIQQNLKIHQMDAVTAFLQGDLDEEIYLEQPEGFSDGSKMVCRLNRAIYGLKQAGRQWNSKLCGKLKDFGLKKCTMDPCVFYTSSLNLIVAIYVDDFLIFYRSEGELQKLQSQLCDAFKMKDMGPAKGCIGIRIKQSLNEIELDQAVYTESILKRFGMEACKPACTPSDTSTKLSINMETDEATEEELRKIPYQEAVGSLLYLAQATRPDIAFAVNDVSRFNATYTMGHWKAVKRIMRYLKGTLKFKLSFNTENPGRLIGFSDADWASDIDKRRSCTGYVFKLSNGAISWKSTRQSTVALSSTEAEYMALSATIQEGIWLLQLCNELGQKLEMPITLKCDNQSAIKIAESDGYRQRSKHIDIRFHYIREKIENKMFKIEYLNTEKMVADSLTKAVCEKKTTFCAKEMGLGE